MIIRQALQAYVLANPGKKLREITAGIGITGRAEITNAGAQLYQLVKQGLLAHEVLPGQLRGFRYYPTDQTLTTRRHQPTPAEIAENARNREIRKQEARRVKRRLSAAQQQAYYANAPVPPKIVAPTALAPLPPPPTAPRPAGKVETVEEFLARNGRIQVLDPHATSNPLRFDHSNGSALNKPVRRTRVAVAP